MIIGAVCNAFLFRLNRRFGLAVKEGIEDVASRKSLHLICVYELGEQRLIDPEILIGRSVCKLQFQQQALVLHVIDEGILNGICVFREALGNGCWSNADKKRVPVGDLACHLLCLLRLGFVQNMFVRMPFLHQLSVGLFEFAQLDLSLHFKQLLIRIDPLHSDRFYGSFGFSLS